MRTCGLLIALLTMPLLAAHAQEIEAPEGATIASVRVTGIETDRLSPGLRDEIDKLVGTALNRQRLRELTARIEAEQPRFVAAVRAIQDPDGAALVIFIAARLPDTARDDNVNFRYIVEDVYIDGVPARDLEPGLHADLQALVGKLLGSDDVERLETRLKQALPGHDVERRTARGSRPGHVRLIFRVSRAESSRWLHFERGTSNAVVYHSDQGWGANLPLTISGRDQRITPIIAIDNGDDLIEEYSGFGLRVEARNLGTERLGASLEWSTFGQTWRDATLEALALDPGIPDAYDHRSTVTPLARFAVTPDLSVGAGVSITELDPRPGTVGSRMANAAVVSIGYERRWTQDAGRTQRLDAAFTVRAGSAALESDLVYRRYLGQGAYWHQWARHMVIVTGMAGGITGDAPVFERFSLGDSRTLRGWNKYDIAPAGADRMFHASVEYRYRGLALFVDSGSVWNRDTDRRFRVATGLGFHPGPMFFTVGFPVNTDELRAVFTMGISLSVGMRYY